MNDNNHYETPEVVGGSGQRSNALGITSLVTGIIGAIISFCCPYLGIPLGIVSVVCGFLGKGQKQQYAVAGLILGFVSIGLGLLSIILGSIINNYMGQTDWEEFFRELIEQSQ